MGKSGAPSWWDRFLVSVAPKWGMNRISAKASLRNFDAAGGGRRTSGWHRSSGDANAANAMSLPVLRELSRDIRRNNGWARRGIQVIAGNTVGWGIEAKAVADSEEVGRKAQSIWKAWSRSTSCDFNGQLTFSGLQRLVMTTVVESGSALVLRQKAKSADGLPVPVRIRVLEPDYIDVGKNSGGSKNKNSIVQGIEFDNGGRRVAYWLFEHHPGTAFGSGGFTLGAASKRVVAKDVIHVYDVERAGQNHGTPWLASAITKLQDFDDYDDARLMQAKIAACFGAFVTDLDGTGSALGEPDDEDDRIETLSPGHIEYLAPGQSVEFPSPPSTSDHGSFSVNQLRRVAASLGVTYEDLTGDYSNVNFSSARMARLSHWTNVYSWQWNMLIPQFCDRVWGWVMELSQTMNEWPEAPSAGWSPPPMPMISPEKEGLAYQRLIRSGTMTLFQAIRERGEDPVSHLAEIAAGNEMMDQLGISLDSDPRKTSSSGGQQPNQPEAADVEEDEE